MRGSVFEMTRLASSSGEVTRAMARPGAPATPASSRRLLNVKEAAVGVERLHRRMEVRRLPSADTGRSPSLAQVARFNPNRKFDPYASRGAGLLLVSGGVAQAYRQARRPDKHRHEHR